MERSGCQKPGPIDARMLREMTVAARDFKRSRGDNRVAAIERYVIALNRFNNVALRRLESSREKRLPRR